MAKYCKHCDAFTNCTDDCNHCDDGDVREGVEIKTSLTIDEAVALFKEHGEIKPPTPKYSARAYEKHYNGHCLDVLDTNEFALVEKFILRNIKDGLRCEIMFNEEEPK